MWSCAITMIVSSNKAQMCTTQIIISNAVIDIHNASGTAIRYVYKSKAFQITNAKLQFCIYYLFVNSVVYVLIISQKIWHINNILNSLPSHQVYYSNSKSCVAYVVIAFLFRVN